MSIAAQKTYPSEDNSKRFQQAAENYRHAMSSDRERDKWIENYLPLVKSIVNRLRYHFPENYETEDMYGIGVRSLILAVNRYDPAKGKSFGNYAALRIKGGLLDELRRIDHLPRANRAKAKSLQSTILELELALKRPPTPEEICKELKLSAAEYNKLLEQTQPIVFVPLEAKSSHSDGEESISSLGETLHDPTELSAFEHVERKEKISLLRDRIKELPEQSQKILMLYYIEELRLSEIAQVFKLSEGRISQILSHSIISLRAKFQTSE
jgi:RNA polymerase sigma factor for flagellar operon FliA|tara:strand:+ start:794 stop:1597 length:804 start_codon:yes stop_codon:yes gene_type:complete